MNWQMANELGSPEPQKNTWLLAEVSEFESWVRFSDSLKASTKRVYLSRLRQFNKFLAENHYFAGEAEMAFSDVVKLFIGECMESGYFKPLTVRNWIAMFRAMARFHGRSPYEIAPEAFQLDLSIDRARLTPEEKERLLHETRQSGSSRDMVILLMFLTTGVRLREIVSMRMADIQWSDSTVRIRVVAGRSTRYELVNDELKQALQTWFGERSRLSPGNRSEYLLFNADGNRLCTGAIDAALRKLGWRARVNICSRVLRNTRLEERESNQVFVPGNGLGCGTTAFGIS